MADTENWQYILINGKSKRVEVKNPKFKGVKLDDIEDLRPFDKKDEKTGERKTPTVLDAENLKRETFSYFFKKPFKNLLVLTGAGSSLDVGGPLMKDLWNAVENKYTADGFKLILDEVNHNYDDINIESLLSKIEGYCKFVENVEIEIAFENKKLSVIKDEIFEIIKQKCSIKQPQSGESFPHKKFLEKLLQRKLTNPRIKVFTLNYDLLFEYAANEVNAIVIDGFSFTAPRTFSGRFFDYDIVQREDSKLKEEDNFIQRVFHLHKLHGSLNWERDTNDNKVKIVDKPDKPLMVYPREAKYEDSYEQPFFEMMARFQRNLRINNDTLLICIGYSFNDKHINAAIE